MTCKYSWSAAIAPPAIPSKTCRDSSSMTSWDKMQTEDTVSNSSSSSNQDDWLDVEPEQDVESITMNCLFGTKTFNRMADLTTHCNDQHGFDLTSIIQKLQLDFLGAVKLVNFVRSRTKQNLSIPDSITLDDIADDALLQPQLENDAVLYSLDDLLEGQKQGQEPVHASVSDRTHELEAELESVRTQFANYRTTVEETLDRRWEENPGEATGSRSTNTKPLSNDYFESYAFNEIHETMLKDRVRTDGYRDFIYENKHLFKDKVVLDIGCGTGILSMFCAKAGAKRVIAVDNSDIIHKAQEHIFVNGLSDVITCVKGAMEEVVLPVEKVDIIVSEWMGYCLLYEAMLPSVLFARDKYLSPDGLIVPSSFKLWMAPIADPEYISDHISFWQDVYGFDMRPMQEGIHEEVRVEVMPATSICGSPCPFRVFDLYTVKLEDLTFTGSWETVVSRDVEQVYGMLIWFDTFFGCNPQDPLPDLHQTAADWSRKHGGNVAFSTSPFDTPTHWKQGLFLMPESKVPASFPASGRLAGQITFRAAENNARALDIGMTWNAAGKEPGSFTWRLK